MLSTHSALTYNQKALLRKGRIYTVADLILTPPQEIAKRCRVALTEIQSLVDLVCRAQPVQVKTLEEIFNDEGDEKTRQLRLLGQKCTTGDSTLDDVLGGGIRTGMIWEVVGESSAGKTQLALQLSLSIQLSPSQGGLSGSACYLTTSRLLETHRLKQIAASHPLFSASSDISLDDIHTLRIPEISTLENVLESVLPKFIQDTLNTPTKKAIRLLIIDALGELFHLSSKTSTQTLVQRSQNVSRISSLLHSLASTYGLAIVVLNEVVDAFQSYNGAEEDDSGIQGLLYASHSRWFQRAHSLPGEDRKEASLGLVWANQVNARIMLSRTGRRRYFYQPEEGKKQRTDADLSSGRTEPEPRDSQDSATLIRRLTVIFSSVSPSCPSVDYIVTKRGIEVLEDSDPSLISRLRPILAEPTSESSTSTVSGAGTSGTVVAAGVGSDETAGLHSSFPPPSTQLAPLDIGFTQFDEGDDSSSQQGVEKIVGETEQRGEVEGDEWEEYWAMDEITEEMYLSVDQTS